MNFWKMWIFKDLIFSNLLILGSPYFKLEFKIELVLFCSLTFDQSVLNVLMWMIFCYLFLVLWFIECRILNSSESRCSGYLISLCWWFQRVCSRKRSFFAERVIEVDFSSLFSCSARRSFCAEWVIGVDFFSPLESIHVVQRGCSLPNRWLKWISPPPLFSPLTMYWMDDVKEYVLERSCSLPIGWLKWISHTSLLFTFKYLVHKFHGNCMNRNQCCLYTVFGCHHLCVTWYFNIASYGYKSVFITMQKGAEEYVKLTCFTTKSQGQESISTESWRRHIHVPPTNHYHKFPRFG